MNIKIPAQGGVTLIELLVSIAIIALLSSIVFSIQSKFRMRARDAQRVQNAEQLVKALQLYANGDIAGVDFPVSGLLSADGTGFVAKDSNDDALYFFAGYGWTTNILRAPISSITSSTSSPDVSQNPPWKVKANQ